MHKYPYQETKYAKTTVWLPEEVMAELDALVETLYPGRSGHKRSQTIGRMVLASRVENGFILADERMTRQ